MKNHSSIRKKTNMNRRTSFTLAALLLTSLASLLCECQTKPRPQAAAKPVAGDPETNFVTPPDPHQYSVGKGSVCRSAWTGADPDQRKMELLT
jgi:hypothetical protein